MQMSITKKMTHNANQSTMHTSYKGSQSAKKSFKTSQDTNQSINHLPKTAKQTDFVHPWKAKRKKSHLSPITYQNSGRNRVKRAKKRLKEANPRFSMLCLLWLSLVTMLALPLSVTGQPISVAGQKTVCNQDDWYYGFVPEADITFKAAAFCPDCDLIAAGGTKGTDDAYFIVKNFATSVIIQEFAINTPTLEVLEVQISRGPTRDLYALMQMPGFQSNLVNIVYIPDIQSTVPEPMLITQQLSSNFKYPSLQLTQNCPSKSVSVLVYDKISLYQLVQIDISGSLGSWTGSASSQYELQIADQGNRFKTIGRAPSNPDIYLLVGWHVTPNDQELFFTMWDNTNEPINDNTESIRSLYYLDSNEVSTKPHLNFFENDPTRFDVVFSRSGRTELVIYSAYCPSLKTDNLCQISRIYDSFQATVTTLQAIPRDSPSEDFTILIMSDVVDKYVLIKMGATGILKSSNQFFATAAQVTSFPMNWAGLVLAPTADFKFVAYSQGNLFTFDQNTPTSSCANLSIESSSAGNDLGHSPSKSFTKVGISGEIANSISAKGPGFTDIKAQTFQPLELNYLQVNPCQVTAILDNNINVIDPQADHEFFASASMSTNFCPGTSNLPTEMAFNMTYTLQDPNGVEIPSDSFLLVDSSLKVLKNQQPGQYTLTYKAAYVPDIALLTGTQQFTTMISIPCYTDALILPDDLVASTFDKFKASQSQSYNFVFSSPETCNQVHSIVRQDIQSQDGVSFDLASMQLALIEVPEPDLGATEMNFVYSVQAVEDANITKTKNFKIRYCTYSMPAIKSEYTVLTTDPTSTIDFSSVLLTDDCSYSVEVESTDPVVFTFNQVSNLLTIDPAQATVTGATYELEYRLKKNSETIESITFYVVVKYCPLQLPAIFETQTSWKFNVPSEQPAQISFTGSSVEQCQFKTRFDGLESYSFITTQLNTSTNESDQLYLDLSKQTIGKVIQLKYTKERLEGLAMNILTQTFSIELVSIEADVGTDCTPHLVLFPESVEESYTLTQGQDPVVIDLSNKLKNNNCKYELNLIDMSTGQTAHPHLFKVTAPVFEQVSKDSSNIVKQTSAGSISMQAMSSEQVGTYLLQLVAIDGQTRVTQNFQVRIKPCFSVLEDSIVDDILVESAISAEPSQFQIPSINPSCHTSSFGIASVQPQELPAFLRFTQDKSSMTMWLETSLMKDIGSYKVDMFEFDSRTEKNITYHVTFEVYERLDDEAQTESKISTWLQEILLLRQKRDSDKDEVDALTANVLELTPKAKLTIVFSKPIIMPPIEIGKQTDEKEDTAATNGTVSFPSSQLSRKRRSKQVSVKKIVQLFVESSFYDEESEEIRILDYYATEVRSTAIDIQIEFALPPKLAQSRSDPDTLMINFIRGEIFIDEADFQRLESSLAMNTNVVQQQPEEEQEKYQKFKTDVMNSMTSIAVSNIVTNSILGVGLKYLWGIVNLLQFVVFMRTWNATIPVNVDIFLEALKTLALFEFLPTDQIDDTLIEWFGINEDKEYDVEQQSWFDDLAVVMIFTFIILFLLLILLLAFCLKRCCNKLQGCYQSLQQKLFYGTFIRYILTSSFKLQISLCTGLAIGNLIQPTVLKPEKSEGFVTIASIIVGILGTAPAIFGLTLWRNRENLLHPEVKQKIGAMYEFQDAKSTYVGTFSVIFLVRRSLFVMITFALFYLPGIQVQMMVFMSIVYLCYIVSVRFHQSIMQYRVELLNELLLVCICYHFVLFANDVWDREFRDQIGLSTIIFICFLLGINVLLIFFVNVKLIYKKIKAKYCGGNAKKKAEIEQKEKVKDQAEAQKKAELEQKDGKNLGPDLLNPSQEAQAKRQEIKESEPPKVEQSYPFQDFLSIKDHQIQKPLQAQQPIQNISSSMDEERPARKYDHGGDQIILKKHLPKEEEKIPASNQASPKSDVLVSFRDEASYNHPTLVEAKVKVPTMQFTAANIAKNFPYSIAASQFSSVKNPPMVAAKVKQAAVQSQEPQKSEELQSFDSEIEAPPMISAKMTKNKFKQSQTKEAIIKKIAQDMLKANCRNNFNMTSLADRPQFPDLVPEFQKKIIYSKVNLRKKLVNERPDLNSDEITVLVDYQHQAQLGKLISYLPGVLSPREMQPQKPLKSKRGKKKNQNQFNTFAQ